jgi:hypothetical protein
MSITNKETIFSLHNLDNYKKEIDSNIVEIVDKITILVTEYLKFILENITIKNKNYASFVIIRGLNTILSVFRHLLYYTKNVDLTFFHCQKSFYFYVEFVGQILEDDKSFLQLTSRDATIYVYKKTIYEANHEIKKRNHQINTSNVINAPDKKTINTIDKNNTDKLNIINSYINICIIYVNKIIQNNFIFEKKNIEYFDSTMNKLKLLNLNYENLQIMEKTINKFNHIITNTEDFFDINLFFFKKVSKSHHIIQQIYDTISLEDFNEYPDNSFGNLFTLIS